MHLKLMLSNWRCMFTEVFTQEATLWCHLLFLIVLPVYPVMWCLVMLRKNFLDKKRKARMDADA